MMMIPIAVAIIITIIPETGRMDNLTGGQRSLAKCLVISIPYAASIGGIATIIGTPPNGTFAAQLETLFPAAATGGYYLNPDRAFTRGLVRGLLVNLRRYGYISCPCDYRDPDLYDHGACCCACTSPET